MTLSEMETLMDEYIMCEKGYLFRVTDQGDKIFDQGIDPLVDRLVGNTDCVLPFNYCPYGQYQYPCAWMCTA